MSVSHWCTRTIRAMFYLLVIIVPVILTPWNYELFEYNKMMFTYATTAIIAGAWVIKMIDEREVAIAKTPLDIPIALFFLSQLISTIFSMDPHVSWLGYYSRFNGGMLSIISYVVLYYAFVSTMVPQAIAVSPSEKKGAKKATFSLSDIPTVLASLIPFLRVALVSATVVAFYGIAERLGVDKHLWVQDVQNRVFSSLGQPNWLAAYLVALFPITTAFALHSPPLYKNGSFQSALKIAIHLFWLSMGILFFLVLLFTRSRSGLLGFAVADVISWGLFFLTSRTRKQIVPTFVLMHVVFALIIFVNGSNIAQLDQYISLSGIRRMMTEKKTMQSPAQPAKPEVVAGPALETGGTESGTIRKYVWQGAINAWKSTTKTIAVGTGTETFAFAFYQFRPKEHNLTSEWDFLYNKAHNEYLNYLATTGAFGLGSYILFLGTILVWVGIQMVKRLPSAEPSSSGDELPVAIAVFSGWLSILVTNFFGFSVVILQLFLFLFPAMILLLFHTQLNSYRLKLTGFPASGWAKGIGAGTTALILVIIMAHWYADTLYATAYRSSRSGAYAKAKTLMDQAIVLNPGEPVYRDELSTTLAALTIGAYEQKNATVAAQLASQALAENDRATRVSPKNVNFWKTRTKIYYSFSALDPEMNKAAIGALERTSELSPNDPKVYYNLAILLGREGDNAKAIEMLKKSIDLKRDYHDAYYGLYVFYTEINKPAEGKAILEGYLKTVDANDIQFNEILGTAPSTP